MIGKRAASSNVAVSVLAMLLAGCGSRSDRGPDANMQLGENGVPMTRARPTEKPQLARLYLVAFEGRWGLTPGDCDLSQGARSGSLHILKNQLDFYESGGTIERVVAATPNNATIDVALKAGDRRWLDRMNLKLLAGGTRLLRTEPNGTKFRYTRC